ncbi:MAG: hypothetical protein Kow0059_01530 [Candidatus Sumerlaeia bacterium]
MPRTILIADDSDDIRSLMRMTLKFKGYTVLECEDGQGAYDTLAANPDVDLLITDIAMPRMTGLQLVEKLRSEARFAKLPIVVCSAENKAIQEDVLSKGASAILVKPFSPKDLLDLVGRMLE